MGLVRAYRNRNKVLGLNSRHLDYIRPNNKRRAFRIADDKVVSKQILAEAELPVPELIKEIKTYQEIDELTEEDLPKSFVLKPARGALGAGIDIFYNKVNGHWIRADRSKATLEDLKQAMRPILEGQYALFNGSDSVMIEERVKTHPAFKNASYRGTPDVRVIAYNGVPVMAMLRLATKESKGKANLAQGAIGAAIDISAGVVMTAIKGKTGEIEKLPHNGQRISGMKIPYWNDILKYTIKAQRATKLGFISVDFLLDREKGPMIVEVNARSGLSIQLADKEGLRSRLERVQDMKIKSIKHGIRVGKELFGGEFEDNLEQLSGKQVVGIIETIELTGPTGLSEKIKAKIDTGADTTSIDRKVLERLGYGPALSAFDEFMEREFDEEYGMSITYDEAGDYAYKLTEKLKQQEIEGVEYIYVVSSSHGRSYRPYLSIKMKLGEKAFTTLCSSYDRSKLTYSVIVGKRSLKNYLVDVTKR